MPTPCLSSLPDTAIGDPATFAREMAVVLSSHLQTTPAEVAALALDRLRESLSLNPDGSPRDSLRTIPSSGDQVNLSHALVWAQTQPSPFSLDDLLEDLFSEELVVSPLAVKREVGKLLRSHGAVRKQFGSGYERKLLWFFP